MWNVVANQEYQTLDLTWMAWTPWLPYLISHITIAWETAFIVLIWNHRLRPLVLAMGRSGASESEHSWECGRLA